MDGRGFILHYFFTTEQRRRRTDDDRLGLGGAEKGLLVFAQAFVLLIGGEYLLDGLLRRRLVGGLRLGVDRIAGRMLLVLGGHGVGLKVGVLFRWKE